MNSLIAFPISAFRANNQWVLRNDRNALVVDLDEAQPVLDYLAHSRASGSNSSRCQ